MPFSYFTLHYLFQNVFIAVRLENAYSKTMIERNSLYHLEFYKHTYFSGSMDGMRFRIERQDAAEKDPVFLVTVFPGPYGFEATPEEKKETAVFPYSEEGLDAVCDYLNKRYSDSPDVWHEAARLR